MIRVDRRIYNSDGTYQDPFFENFKPILCLTKSTKYGSLGPYELKNEKSQIMENIYQFSKVYETVPKTIQRASRYDATIIWNYPTEKHVNKISEEEFEILPEYYEWRNKGFNSEYAIRYPVGFNNRSKCLFAIKDIDAENITLLDYIEARKEIYLPLYISIVQNKPQFQELKKYLDKGINLLIIEVDGPHEESLNYYMKKYKVNSDFIINNTILVTEDNMKIMLNDEKHAFGHGYCLAIALLDLEVI
jgi:hypothetical protein